MFHCDALWYNFFALIKKIQEKCQKIELELYPTLDVAVRKTNTKFGENLKEQTSRRKTINTNSFT